MEKVLNFIKTKAVGYFLVAANVFLALVLTIIFFATYKGAMANNASALVPETIGIFLIAGAIVEIVVLVLPQYRFVHIVALVMFGLALYKEIILIPNLIADEINNVHYQGGNLGTQIFYLITLIIIVSLAIAAAFVGFYKTEEEANAEMPIKGTNKIVKVSCCGVIALAAVLTSSIISLDMKAKMSVAKDSDTWTPINEAVKKAAADYNYSFDPSNVIIKEKDQYDFTDALVKNVPTTETREGHNMVYYFEGAYSEGYQGDYSSTYGYICLWEDGVYGGKINDIKIKGYWFNSSIEKGKDAKGNDIKDCLKMVSDYTLNDKITVNNQKVDNYKHNSLIAEDAKGFYTYQIYAYLNFSWGERSMILGGYEYYPEVALAINTQDSVLETYVGEEYDMSSWVPTRVLKNLEFSSVFKPVDVTWTAEDGSVDIQYVDGQKNRGIASIIGTFNSVGEKKVTIKWGGYEASVTVKVTEAPAEEE